MRHLLVFLFFAVSVFGQKDGSTSLHEAVENEDMASIRALLRLGTVLEATTRNGGLTPLLLASRNGSPAIVAELLNAGANPNKAGVTGVTPLMFAAASGEVESLRLLIEKGAQVNAKENANEQTALMFAAALNRVDAVKFLIRNGAALDAKTKLTKLERLRVDMDGNIIPAKEGAASPTPDAPKPVDTNAGKAEPSPSKPAESKPESRKAGDVANLGPRESGTTLVGGMTALLFSARDGHVETVKTLLDAGTDINQASESEKATPLVIAIVNGHYDVAKLLLDRGADPNLLTTYGLGPLYATIDVQWAPKAWYPQPDTSQQKTTYLDLLTVLLDRGANPNVKLEKGLWFRGLAQDPTWADAKGSTPFWRAAQSSDVATMKLLLAAKADPTLASAQGVTPLMVAAGIGWMANHSTNVPAAWLDAVKLCIDQAIDVNAADTRGYTALHGAAYIGHNDMVNYLVSKGAKVDAVTKAGDTVADMANGPTRFGLPHPETVALLEKLGSKNSHNCRSDQCIPAAKPDMPKKATDSAKPSRS